MIPLPSNRAVPTRIGLLVASLAALLAAMPAHASFMQGETLAKAANVLAIVVIVIVPIIGITVFWLVHILPEKIAHKRHHPQTEAIQVLCLLSLVFGGLLWPLAWLWAYSKPVMYKLAYGRDKSDDYYAGPAAQDVGQALVWRDDVVAYADQPPLVQEAPQRAAQVRTGGGSPRAVRVRSLLWHYDQADVRRSVPVTLSRLQIAPRYAVRS